MTQLRWKQLDAQEAQLSLPGMVRREVGRGEYRGLEFLEVEARSIVNKVPRVGYLPFEHTINAYRGCSHACSFCFARPTHEYLGLGPGADLETKIVVKVNAVALARHETSPARGGGDLIAMGTNTDPYQPAEGKYRLTRGIVEVLAERRNPFSLLTKSSLVLRDVDLLAEAARATDVTVNFSVGTLDPEVWRLTEPGTPHPMRRIEAVRKLNDAGVPAGVLMGPILPGLSDHPDQIEEVVAAAVAAGAVSVGALWLHLKPGVKEHYLAFLERERPDLVGMHRARYAGRSRLPARHHEELSALVAGMVRHHRAQNSRSTSESMPRRRS